MHRQVKLWFMFGALFAAGCVSPKGNAPTGSHASVVTQALEDVIEGAQDDSFDIAIAGAESPSIQQVSRVVLASTGQEVLEGTQSRVESFAGSETTQTGSDKLSGNLVRSQDIVRASWTEEVGDGGQRSSGVPAVFDRTALKTVAGNGVTLAPTSSPGNSLAAYFAGIPEAGEVDLQAFSIAEAEPAKGPSVGTVAAIVSDELPLGFPEVEQIEAGEGAGEMERSEFPAVDGIQVNLPTVLAMVDSQHPAVGIAQWRVQQAYAQLTQARSLWLPSIRGGLSLHRHDGNYQASNGDIVDVNRSSLQYGLGAGATGAGTTAALPGVVAQFHFADAIFQPSIAQSRAHAQGHAARAVINRQMLESGLAYLELIAAHQDIEIIKASQVRIEQLAELTKSFAEAGEGLQADADRLQTEWLMIQSRRVAAGERIAVAESRLALSVSGDRQTRWIPMDITVVPWEMVGTEIEAGELVSVGLRGRPELRESQSLVAAACDAYDREKFAPFVPSVLLGFSTGGFGGGLGGQIEDVRSRYDFDAIVGWEIRNFGFGERAARREASARIQQAKFEKLRVLDTIANEITESAVQVKSRQQQIQMNLQAIEVAESSVRRNLERIRAGEGLPIEALQAVQASELASQAYLRAVTRYNEAQLRLQFALGWPEVPVESGALEIE